MIRRGLRAREAVPAVAVIALGAAMVLGGAYEVYFGSTYISVERGWSAFISGTVLFTGGLVTVSLGLAIRAITDLKTALTSQVAGSAAADMPAVDPERGFAVPQLVTPSVSTRLEPRSAALASTLSPQPMSQPVYAEPEPHADTYADRGMNMPGHGIVSPTAPEFSAALVSRAEPLDPKDPRLDHAEETAAEPEPVIAEPAMDDWLDRSFADLSRDFRTPAGPSSPVVDEPAAHSEPETVASADAAAEHHEPMMAEPASEHRDVDHVPEALAEEDVAPPTAPTSPVIGRYDAEGTSYVMYADGSIEAQSEAGVYRFASMAELKAFIEG